MLMLSAVLPTAIITTPGVTVRYAKQDGWISIIAATLIGLIIAWLVVELSRLFPGKTLIEYLGEILGKIPGKIVSLMYILVFMEIGSAVIREYGFFLITTIMPDTPIIVFQITVVAVAAYAVRNGLEVLGRFNQLFIPTTGLLAIVFLLSTKDMQLVRLLPLFDTDLVQIIKGTVTPTMWIGEIITLAMIIPYLNKPKEAHGVAFASVLLIGFFITVTLFETLLVFGPTVSGQWFYPVFNVVRIVTVASFLERLESVIITAWVLGGFVKLGVFYYASVLGSAQLLGLKDYRPLILPTGIIFVVLSNLLFATSIVDLHYYMTRVWVPFILIVFEVGIPLILLGIALAKGKRAKSG